METKNNIKFINIFKDINAKQSSNGENINALDGIRSIAVLLVIASHTNGFNLSGQGSVGVWLFFVLSGFLLALPFANNPVKANSAVGMLKFLLRRLKRILPMYFVSIILYYFLYPGFMNNLNQLARHFIFLDAFGHFWSTQQEMLFYIFMPIILYLNYVLFKLLKGNRIVIGSFLLILAMIFNKYLTVSVFYFPAINSKRPFYIAVFLIGMALAYMYVYIKPNKYIQNKYVKCCLTVLGFCVLIIYFVSARYYKNKLGIFMNVDYLGWTYIIVFAFLNSLLILSVVLNNGGLLDKIFSSKVLRSIGVVSYSMYLIHYLLLFHLSKYIHNNILFFTLTILTYLISCITYHFIEKPFIDMKVAFSKKKISTYAQ